LAFDFNFVLYRAISILLNQFHHHCSHLVLRL
jgi:hypothetical protein